MEPTYNSLLLERLFFPSLNFSISFFYFPSPSFVPFFLYLSSSGLLGYGLFVLENIAIVFHK